MGVALDSSQTHLNGPPDFSGRSLRGHHSSLGLVLPLGTRDVSARQGPRTERCISRTLNYLPGHR